MGRPDLEQGRNFQPESKSPFRKLLNLVPFFHKKRLYLLPPNWQDIWPLPGSFTDKQFWKWAHGLAKPSRLQLIDDLRAWEHRRIGVERLADGSFVPFDPPTSVPAVFRKAFEEKT